MDEKEEREIELFAEEFGYDVKVIKYLIEQIESVWNKDPYVYIISLQQVSPSLLARLVQESVAREIESSQLFKQIIDYIYKFLLSNEERVRKFIKIVIREEVKKAMKDY